MYGNRWRRNGTLTPQTCTVHNREGYGNTPIRAPASELQHTRTPQSQMNNTDSNSADHAQKRVHPRPTHRGRPTKGQSHGQCILFEGNPVDIIQCIQIQYTPSDRTLQCSRRRGVLNRPHMYPKANRVNSGVRPSPATHGWTHALAGEECAR